MVAPARKAGDSVRRGRWFLVASGVGIAAIAALATGVAGGPPGGLYRLAGLFGQVVAMVRSSYVEEVSVSRLEEGALNGLVNAADPGGAWIPAVEFPAFEAVRERPLPAFGLVLGVRSSYPVVLQVLPGSPAEQAALAPGEILESIEGEALRGRPLWVAELRLEAAQQRGTPVSVAVIDRWLRGKRDAVLRPGAVASPRPAVEEHDGVLLVRPVKVGGEQVRAIREALHRLGERPGVVVDLRSVVLGDRHSAVELAAVVAGGDIEVPLARRSGSAGALRARGERRTWRVAVCMDVTTAAAGEVAAAAFKRAGATLVGGRSYGDTGERRAVALRESKLWLADTWCLGPNGKGIIGQGLEPDEVVRVREGEDPVLARALEIVRAGAARQAA